MILFYIEEQNRRGRSNLIGPYMSFEKAHKAFLNELCATEDYVYTKYGYNLSKGLYYSEDVSLEIVEKEVQ